MLSVQHPLAVRMLNRKTMYIIRQREGETLQDYHDRCQVTLHPSIEPTHQRFLVEILSNEVISIVLWKQWKEATTYYDLFHNYSQYINYSKHTEDTLVMVTWETWNNSLIEGENIWRARANISKHQTCILWSINKIEIKRMYMRIIMNQMNKKPRIVKRKRIV